LEKKVDGGMKSWFCVDNRELWNLRDKNKGLNIIPLFIFSFSRTLPERNRTRIRDPMLLV